jgi:hypothetical protein
VVAGPKPQGLPPAGTVRAYKPAGARIGLAVVLSCLFGGPGIGLVAGYRQTGWSGVVARVVSVYLDTGVKY